MITSHQTSTTNHVHLVGLFLMTIGIYLIHIIHRMVSRNEHKASHTLYLRKLKTSGGEMLTGGESPNIYVEEYSLLKDYVFPKVDFSVMKVLNTDIPILTKQEHLHAKMHNEAQRERERLGLAETGNHEVAKRWKWYVWLIDLIMLRCGREVGAACAGYAEATSPTWMYLPMKYGINTQRYMNNELVHHSLEELEHGQLTTQYLRHHVSTLTPLALFPLMVNMWTIFFLFPPIFAILGQPKLLLKPRAYSDFVAYYTVFFPIYFLTLCACVAYWVLPFRENDAKHKVRYQYFLDLAKSRGIEFDIIDQQTYRIDHDGNVHVVVDDDDHHSEK